MPYRCPLEFQSALAGGICERLDAPMINIAATVKHHLGDARRLGALGDFLADIAGGFHVPRLGGLAVLFVGRGGSEGRLRAIVDDLRIDVAA